MSASASRPATIATPRYRDIPLAYRSRYGPTDRNRYIYRDQSVYVVDSRTNLVTRILNGLH